MKTQQTNISEVRCIFCDCIFFTYVFFEWCSYIMGNIFPRKNVKTLSENMTFKNYQAEAAAFNEILIQYKIRDSEGKITSTNGGRIYNFTRPGYIAEIIFTEGENSVKVKVNIKEDTIWSVMNDFHRLHGFADSQTHKVWASFYDLS